MIDFESDVACTGQIPESVGVLIVNLYSDYINKLKPTLAAVEAFTQQYPGPVLNEIRALHDHISRCVVANQKEEVYLDEVRKARGHLTRAILDCYKVLILAYDRKVKSFYDQYKDLSLGLVNDGKFAPELRRLIEDAETLVICAKRKESISSPDKEKAYVEYKRAVLAYSKVDKYIRDNSEGLANAKLHAVKRTREEVKRAHKFAVIGALWGTLFGIIATLLIRYFT